jgi:hypothetical protein
MFHMWLELEVADVSNERSPADAGFALCFQFGRLWSRAADSERWAHSAHL